jgi:RHS repeat-associated protein
LGSLIVLTNESGTVVERYAYDPWGARRNPTNWTQTDNRTTWIVNRGYTMHEHLDAFSIINMNGRVYDPLTAQFFSPDPYVQAPGNWLNFNRYAYAFGNPFKYTDPDGEIAWFIPIIIGAVIGGTSGAIMAHQSGAQGFLEWAGYIGGGALIGGLSGGAAVGVSALGGAAWWAGAAAGAVGGAGFSGLATNWDGNAMLKGAAFGAISGFAGGGLGSAIGGGWGAVAGGAASSGLNTALNGGDLKQIGISMILGGALSYGAYELTSYISYKQANLSINNHQVTYKQFKTMQADYQRSRFWRKEYGGILTKNGNVVRVPSQNRHSLRVDFTRGMINAASNDGGSAASYHTHWAKGGIDYYVNNVDDIVSKANALSLVTTSNGPSPGDMNGLANYFGGDQYLIDRNSFYCYNTETSRNIIAFLFRYFPMYWW